MQSLESSPWCIFSFVVDINKSFCNRIKGAMVIKYLGFDPNSLFTLSSLEHRGWESLTKTGLLLCYAECCYPAVVFTRHPHPASSSSSVASCLLPTHNRRTPANMERSDKEEEERGEEEDEADDEGEGNDIVSQLFNYDLYEALQIVFLRLLNNS